MKTPKVEGHRLLTERHERYGSRSAAFYTARCECGVLVQVWEDRLSVARSKHLSHLRTIRLSRS